MTCTEKTPQQLSLDAKVVRARPTRNKRLPVVMDDLAGVVKVPLSNGEYTIVDASDYSFVKQFNWNCIKPDMKFYAITSGNLYMHRMLMNASKGVQVDHINGNGLDNRRSNLRLSLPWQNSANSSGRKRRKSPFKGVCWSKANKSWVAQISAKRMNYYLGMFKTQVDAAKAYDAAALRLHGEFARLNF